MPRSEKQKQKLFRLLEILIRDTDETTGLSMKEIIEKLEAFGISAERKSIYDDVMTLGELGFDVITLPTKPPKYTLLNRPFEFGELKMLVDAVQTSKYVTVKRSNELIEKLLREMQGVPYEERTARFVSVICVVDRDGFKRFYRGECEGIILVII